MERKTTGIRRSRCAWADALAQTAVVLTRMAAPVEFIEAATGRAPANLFPVRS
jgi:hypothetical protein